jgi:hypothetical protein
MVMIHRYEPMNVKVVDVGSGLHRVNIITGIAGKYVTYDHTYWKPRDPVRSPIDKPVRA